MEQSVLDKIVQATNYDIFYNCWANGAIGSIADHSGNCIYRFYQDKKNNGNIQTLSNNDKDTPIVAVGIVAYWLHFRQNNYYLAKLCGLVNPKPKSITQIFQDYTADKLLEFKKRHEQNPSSWRSDVEADFYTQHIIPSEKRLIMQSEALFEYITPDDRQLVRDVMKEYILYLQNIRKKYLPNTPKPKPTKQPIPVRQVNIDKLVQHFKRDFDKTTYFPVLKTLLEEPQSDKELARVALLIYNSKFFLKNDYNNVFSKWYQDYCNIVSCNYHASYEPSTLRKSITKELKQKYYFLL